MKRAYDTLFFLATLEITGRRKIGLQFEIRSESPFLYKYTTLATLKWGKTPEERDRLVMCEMDLETK